MIMQLHLAPEGPVDERRVGHHERHPQRRDDRHDAERLLRRGGVPDGLVALVGVALFPNLVTSSLAAENSLTVFR